MGLAHVAQLRTPLYDLKLAISLQASYAVAYVPGSFRDSPAPRRERRFHRKRPAVDPRFCLTSLGDTARSASGPYQLVATSATAPVVSGRWRVLGAAFRRAIASRKTVPAEVKDQISPRLLDAKQDNHITISSLLQAGNAVRAWHIRGWRILESDPWTICGGLDARLLLQLAEAHGVVNSAAKVVERLAHGAEVAWSEAGHRV